MALATFEDLANATKRRFTEVEIPALGRVRLRSLTAAEFIRIEGTTAAASVALQQGDGKKAARLLEEAKLAMIAECVVDADGNRVFTHGKADTLKEADAALINALEQQCSRHCGALDNTTTLVEA